MLCDVIEDCLYSLILSIYKELKANRPHCVRVSANVQTDASHAALPHLFVPLSQSRVAQTQGHDLSAIKSIFIFCVKSPRLNMTDCEQLRS